MSEWFAVNPNAQTVWRICYEFGYPISYVLGLPIHTFNFFVAGLKYQDAMIKKLRKG